jgi:Uma2 family endonuclease
MMTMDASKYWTYADLFDTPDDGMRYEIIDGKLYRHETPWTAHALAISQLLCAVFMPLVRDLGGELYTGPLGVFMDTADPVLPDIIVLLPDQLHLQSDRGIEGPPALLVEVLGHFNPAHDRVTKRALYARAGLLEYWLVSPEAALIEILVLDGDRYRTHARVGGDEPVLSTVLPELNCLASVIFR